MKTNVLALAMGLAAILAVMGCNARENAGETPASTDTTPAGTTLFSGGETSIQLTLVTGGDGTADNLVFGLFDSSGTVVFTIVLDQDGDLQANQTDRYEFSAPYPFCRFSGWQLTKDSSSGTDDPWLPTRITIELNGETVWLDGTFADLGLITGDSQRGGNWSGIAVYLQQCEP